MAAEEVEARKEAARRALEGVRRRTPRGALRRDLRQETAYLTREPRRAEREGRP